MPGGIEGSIVIKVQLPQTSNYWWITVLSWAPSRGGRICDPRGSVINADILGCVDKARTDENEKKEKLRPHPVAPRQAELQKREGEGGSEVGSAGMRGFCA